MSGAGSVHRSSTSSGCGAARSAPPSPPSLDTGEVEATPPAEVARLLGKSAIEEIPLLAGLNLVSIPEEPADTDPAAVFAAVSGELSTVVAAATCSARGPWLTYDPADSAASDLTAVDHRIGMWVSMSVAAALPSDGTLPATTTIEMCEGWNLIGFPTAEPRHPHVALASIAGKWERIFGYDAFDSDDPWEVFSVDVPDWANDLRMMKPGRGYWVLATEDVTLEIRNEGPPPIVAIASPADLAVVTEPTEIIGTVESDRLASWTLTARPVDDGDAVHLATGNAPVTNGTLATFDPTLLLNGLYELELTATDVQGQQVSESIAVSVEGQMKIGHFTLSFVDLAIPVSGLDIEVVRTYDSRDKQQRDFGVGWSLDIRQGSYRNNRPPGDGWQMQTGFVACDTALESKSHLTVVRLSDQEVYRFALRLYSGEPAVGGGGCNADARFDFIDGPLPGTTLEIMGNDQVFWENGSDRVIDQDTFETYEPEDVRLTTRDGRIFELDLKDGVTLVEDLNGNQLSISPGGVTHSSGKGILFERDAEGRINRITDPMDREMSYAYAAAGDLTSFTDRAGTSTRFTYDGDHLLLDIEDARGVKPVRNEYDAEGRIVRHIDAFGKVIELGHDLDNRRQVVTDRLGHSRVLEYDSRGNVVRETDELGHARIRVFDGRDNLLSETDPLSRTITYSFNAEDLLASMEDPLGHVTSYTYNSWRQPLTVTDPRGGVTTSAYDSSGNLVRTIDAAGKITAFTHDAAGNLLTRTDPLGHVTSFEYDSFGNRNRKIDALGYVTDFTYDGAGNRLTESRSRTLAGGTETLVTTFSYDDLDRLTATTAADGSTTSIAYDVLGNVTERTDALGRVTARTYDLLGRPVTTSHPDGTVESQSYDAKGRPITETDRAGRVATLVYDPADRLVAFTFADGSSTSSTYDAAGQLVTTTDAAGHTTTYAYDAAGRRTAVVDPMGNGPTFSYDANGNPAAVTDANGQTTHFTYDALDRLIATTYPDGSTSQAAYDDLGRLIGRTDQAGITTEYRYDALRRLLSVKDALGQVTSYTSDEVGNRLTQTDANGHVTSFEYDRLGRQTARTFADGSRESMVYDADGTLTRHIGFDGGTRTFQYDASKRLVRRSYPDGSEVTFAYTATGRRAAVTDARGTTTYAYDSRDRLTEKADPTGYKLNYAYDAAGNRTNLTATVGGEAYTTTYSYDLAHRLAAVSSSLGGVTTFGHDGNGNRSSITFPNGVTTTYAYDGLNRLTGLQTATSTGALLNDQYALGPAGNRTRIDGVDGTSRHYLYDALYRLIQDRAADQADAPIYQRDYTYDPVGNRLVQTIDEGGGSSTVVSIYDSRDRLLSAGGTSYSWDAGGNLTSRTGSGGASYGWDAEDRMTSVTLDDGTQVETTYDADGHRVRTAVTPAGGQAAVVDYLVDTEGPLSQVVAEIVDGSVQTLYVRGLDQLIAAFRPASGTRRYFHGDGLGSIVLLTDEAATVTDRYSYSGFGELLQHQGSDPQPYRFAGEPFETESGLYFNRARWLDVAGGRFISVDPFIGLAGNPSSLHRYRYAGADPVNATDPTGRMTLLQLSVRLGIGTILAGLTYTVYDTFDTPRASLARELTATEKEVTRSVFGDEIDFDEVRVFHAKFAWYQRLSRAKYMAPGGNIYVHPEVPDRQYRDLAKGQRDTFVHEMAHVWQHQKGMGIPLWNVGYWHRLITGNYDYWLDSTSQFSDFDSEQQAQIIEDYFGIRSMGPNAYSTSRIEPRRLDRTLLPLYQAVIPFVDVPETP